MRITLLATAGLAIGLLACADGRTPTRPVDVDPALEFSSTPPLFEDGFESGTLLLWDDGASPAHHRIVNDAALAHSGTSALEVSYPAGDQGSWLTKFFYPGYQSVYLSYWIRFPDSWTGGSNLLGVYGSHADDKWSAHGKAGVCPNGQDFFATFLTAADNGDPGAVRLSTYHPAMPRVGTQCWGDEGAATIYRGDGLLTRGAWHRVEFLVHANTPGVADGVQRVWVDGVLRAEWTGVRFRETQDLTINSIQLATYSPTPVSQTRTLYIDDVVVRPGGGRNTIASIEVHPALSTLGVGGRAQLTATARDAAGRPIPGVSFSWRSSDPATVAVSSTGLVRALRRGNAFIAARAGGRVGRAQVRVESTPVVASVTIAPASGSVAVGQSLQFVATAKDAAGNPLTGIAMAWSSSQPQYATVDTAGRATGRAAGVTNVTATSGVYSATATLTVTEANPPPPPPPSPAPVASVVVTPATASVEVGQSTQFTATLRDSAGNTLVGRTIAWHSNSPGLASVDTAGRATGLATGTATIVATSEGKSASASLTVNAPPPPPVVVTRMDVTPATATVAIGATRQFAATEVLSDGTSRAATGVTWTATGGTVTVGGLYTAGSSAGSYRVIGTKGAFADTAAVTIPAPVVVTQILVTPASVTLATGATQQFTATAQMSNGTQQPAVVTWTATGGTVSAGGLYTAGTSAGTSYRVIATQQGGPLADTSAITITASPPPPSGSLAWFEDFRLSLTDKGMTQIASNATINRIPKSSATGTWPSQLTHVAENVYVAEMNAAYQALNLWPAPAVGQYLFGRMLLNNSLPNGANTGGDHGFQSNVFHPIVWFWRIWGGDADSFTLEFTTWDNSGTRELQLDVPKDRVLRLEWRAQRTGTSTATVSARVYNNETGALLGEITGLGQSAATHFREFLFGMSGQAPTSFNGGSVYWGALAFRVSDNANDWIGPYPVVGVER